MRDWLTQLRSLPPPFPLQNAVCSFDGSPCRSLGVHHMDNFGPFPSEDDFHEYLFRPVSRDCQEEVRAKASTRPEPHCICFTHDDIHPGNVLYHNGRLSGLVDWECAGWYPEYWDYTYALYTRIVYEGWRDVFQRIFPQYDRELEVEKAFWKVHNPW